MKHIVRETNEVASLFRNDRFYRLGRVEESLPSGSSNFFGKCRRTAAAVERVIPVPERSPTGVVGSKDGSYCELVRHMHQSTMKPRGRPEVPIKRRRRTIS